MLILIYVEIIDADTGALIDRREQCALPRVGKRTIVGGRAYSVVTCDKWEDGRYEGAIIEVACGVSCSGIDIEDAQPMTHRSK